MAQGNKPVIYYRLAPGGTRFIYAPPAYHGEIGVQNCNWGKTYPNHFTIHVAEERDHPLGEIEAYCQEDRYHNSRNTYRHILQNVCHNPKLAYNHTMELNGIDSEGYESNQEEHIPAQEVEQVQGQPIEEMNGMMEEFEEDPKEDLEKEPKENHGGNVEEKSESSDGIMVVD
ncbi:hypothetical protein ACH5RR_034662 [Cinchona calisaya]|uniref:Uncharacterized protein n=1 Tax=Cinchona calisaya TaxID=153742 RepID=A0ABD2YDP1_9GENT